MKKIFFYCFLTVLASFLLTCKDFHPTGGFEDEVVYTDVVYSQDGKSLTVYLDGATVPVSKSRSRALTLELAKLGHDYFEVAFLHKPSNTIARAAWETGHFAGIKGVYRGGADYGSPDPSNTASAIIFVGKKSDKTLLAVGNLTGTSEGDLVTSITADTKWVTFTVAALEAATSFDAEDSSFWTGNPVPDWPITVITPVIVRDIFPLYKLPLSSTIRGDYRFDVKGGGFGGYLNGILVANNGATLQKVMPRYPYGTGNHETLGDYYTEDYYDTGPGSTVVSFRNNSNQTPNAAFQNPVEFLFTTGTLDDILIPGKAFALVFQIPVYPLFNDGRGTADPWFIRPGYDSYFYDLDDGTKMATGGAVLIGIGDIGFLGLRLSIDRQPYKVIYKNEPGNANPQWQDFKFYPDGIIAYMTAGNRKLVRCKVEDLRFFVDEANIQINSSTTAAQMEGYFSSHHTDGMLTIRVEYTFNTTVYYDYFVIVNSNAAGFNADENMPASNLVVISGPADVLEFQNTMTTAGTYVIVFRDSVDLGQYTFNTGGMVIIMLAGAKGVVIGRGANTAFTSSPPALTENQFFFGMWPFNGAVVVDGMPIDTYLLTVNAAGSYATVGGSPQYANNFVGGTMARTSVFVGGGANIVNPAQLPYP
jgi:hypothetical protein